MTSLLFDLAEKLTGELCSPLFRDFVEKSGELGIQSEFEKLQNTVAAIKHVLLDVEEKERTDRQVQDWLTKIKIVFYDLEDLLQEVRTEDLKRRLESKKRSKTVRIFSSVSNKFKDPFKMGPKVKLIRERLEAIASDGKRLDFTERTEELNVVGIMKREETHSFVDKLIGRDADKECVIKHLLQSDVVDNVSVVSIVGIGGIGKTALAQSVYNSEEVKSKFELRMWVCVCDPFDVKLICENIIEAATGNKCERLLMDGVKDELKEAIGGRKYLLVLDDVWNESSTEWDELEMLLSGGAKGSKILITARSESVARAAMSVATHALKGLSAEDAWWLFEEVAFKRRVKQASPTMEGIGKEVIEKSAGVPLVVKAFGNILSVKEEEADWVDFRKNHLPLITQDSEGTVVRILKLSYDYLPAHLKRCFVYCAIYPKDHEIEKEELIEMWVAHGFIHLDGTGRELEDVGEQYFKDLLDRSFFEVHKRAFIGGTCYKMHDLIHDLAQSLGRDEYYNLESDANYIGKSTRHMWVSGDKLTNKFLDRKKLRTLVLTSSGDKQKFDELTSTFEQLRVLILRHLQLASVPRFVGGSRHLYYLDLSGNHSSSLPESICSLYNLQTLILSNCVNLKELPAGTRNLVNLRRLDVSGCRKLRHMPRGLEELTCLQTLILSNCDNMEELPAGTRDLVNLRHLDVSGCRKLSHMPWGLENLACLETLILSNCDNVEELLPGTRGLLSLMHLDVSGCRKLSHMPWGLANLPNLQTLILSNCDNMEELPAGTRDFLKLRHLDVSGCRKLRHMPSGLENLPCLQTLILSNCVNLEELPAGTRKLVSLRHLDVSGCPKLRHMPSGLEELTCLQTLILSNCINLEELPAETRKLVSLRYLDVSGSPKLRHMPRGLEEPTCLQTLNTFVTEGSGDKGGKRKSAIHTLDLSYTNIKSLPEFISEYVAVRELKLKGCQLLMELGPEIGEFFNLEELDLEGTEIICLPKEIAKLINLKSLKFTLCGYADQFQETKQIALVIPQKALSNLLQLNELSIDVTPHGDWWNAEVKTVIDDLHCLQELKILRLYIPTVDLFGYLIQRIKLLIDQDSVCFRFTVGHHERLVSRLPEGVLKEFDDLEKFKKGLKFTSGEGMSIEIANALQHMDAFLLERHWSINNLLEFGLRSTENLKFCILSECNELQTVIDTKQYNDFGQTIMGSLQHLSIHYMKSLQKIWRGPVTEGSMSNLKSLALYSCVSLTIVFKIDMLANLTNLEELRIEDCPKLKTLASSSFSDISPLQDFLPKLKSMLLLELPNLHCISSGLAIAPKLERLVILYCPNLKKLSTTEISSKDLQVLKGTKGWWDALKWYESDVTEDEQNYLTRKFIPLKEDGDLEEQFLRD